MQFSPAQIAGGMMIGSGMTHATVNAIFKAEIGRAHV